MFRGILGISLAVISFLTLVILGLAAVFLTLPDVRILKGCMTTELYHVHVCESDGHYAEFGQISPYIIGAVVMSEDASFYSHQGVDLYEMKESVKKDLNEFRFARGASTITQQLAKNAFLSKSKNLLRKFEEIYLALQLEKYYTKPKILTLYLNMVEFGDGLYGIKDATQYYFQKTPAEVNPEEAAFLAFLLPNPKKYSQSYRFKKLTPFAEKATKTILHKMMLGHKISEDEYASAMARVPLFPWGVGASEPLEAASQPGTPDQEGVQNNGKPIEMDEEKNTEDDNFKFDFTPEENL